MRLINIAPLNPSPALQTQATIFGDTFPIWATPDSIIKAASPFITALSLQPSGAPFNVTTGQWAHFHQLSGRKPMLVADVGFAYPHPPYTKIEWKMYLPIHISHDIRLIVTSCLFLMFSAICAMQLQMQVP